jgi:hypothetical protein
MVTPFVWDFRHTNPNKCTHALCRLCALALAACAWCSGLGCLVAPLLPAAGGRPRRPGGDPRAGVGAASTVSHGAWLTNREVCYHNYTALANDQNPHEGG